MTWDCDRPYFTFNRKRITAWILGIVAYCHLNDGKDQANPQAVSISVAPFEDSVVNGAKSLLKRFGQPGMNFVFEIFKYFVNSHLMSTHYFSPSSAPYVISDGAITATRSMASSSDTSMVQQVFLQQEHRLIALL